MIRCHDGRSRVFGCSPVGLRGKCSENSPHECTLSSQSGAPRVIVFQPGAKSEVIGIAMIRQNDGDRVRRNAENP